MAFTKYASFEFADVLDMKGSEDRLYTASLDKVSEYNDFRTSDDYLYVRIRAISSRVNQNHDGWPTEELAGSSDILAKHHSADGFTVEASAGNPKFGFATFMGKPIFVDHNNGDPKKTRGMIVDTKFRVLDHKTASEDPYWSSKQVDSAHLPASEVELLLEIDAKNYPKFAKAVKLGHIDGFSMGCNCEFSICSHCNNKAHTSSEFCSHVKLKGIDHDFKTASGEHIKKKSYENVGGIQFFEISGVFNPADETALTKEVIAATKNAEFYDHNGQPAVDPMRGPQSDYLDGPMAQNPNNRGPLTTPMNEGYESIPYQVDPNAPNPEGGFSDYEGLEIPPNAQGVDHHGLPQGAPPPARPAPPGGIYDQALHGGPEAQPNQVTMNDPRWSSVHTAENELPQSMLVHAPDAVDTLRDEHICPVCGSEMEGETCDVCGYTQPPKEFDNPDLNKSQEIRDQMKQMEEQAAQPQAQPGQQAPNAGGAPQMPNKAPSTAGVNNRMSWTPLVTEKTAAKINKVETPVLQPNTIVTNQPSNQVVLSDQKTPVTSAMLTAQRLMEAAQRNHIGETMSNTHVADGATPPEGTSAKERVDVTGQGGFDEASNEAASAAQKQVDVTGKGGTGVEGVEADSTETLPTADAKSDDSGFNTDKITESIPTKTFGDSDGTEKGITDPVTSDPFPASEDGVKKAAKEAADRAYYAAYEAVIKTAYDDGTLEQNEQQGDPVAKGGTAVKGNQPIAETFGTRENVLEHKTSPDNNSGPTKTWSGTDGNGVNKQQDPVTKDKMEFGGVPTPDVTLHTTGSVRISSIRLAELEIELGLPEHPADEKFNRIAELDTFDETKVAAQIEALSSVKTAGLAKLAQTRVAGVTKVPALFGKSTAAPNGFERIANDHSTAAEAPIDDNVLDSAIFGR